MIIVGVTAGRSFGQTGTRVGELRELMTGQLANDGGNIKAFWSRLKKSDLQTTAVMDFSLQELANHCAGSIVTAGADRLEDAGRRGTPQIVAPGAIDMIDFPTWRESRWGGEGRNYHAHNRLLASVTATAEERRRVARHIAEKLSLGAGPTVYLVPQHGIEGWDRKGEQMHAPEALAAFLDETRRLRVVRLIELDAHINDLAFAEAALAILGDWVLQGRVPKGLA